MFGYFALGVFLGLLFGALIAAILILVVIKCCDKGKMAPYYTVSPVSRALNNLRQTGYDTILECFKIVYLFLEVSN